MKVTINGFISHKKQSWVNNEFHFHDWDYHEDGYISVMPLTIEFEVPDDFNPIPQQVAALEKDKQELKAKFAKDLMTLEDRISKLTCISMDEPS